MSGSCFCTFGSGFRLQASGFRLQASGSALAQTKNHQTQGTKKKVHDFSIPKTRPPNSKAEWKNKIPFFKIIFDQNLKTKTLSFCKL